MTDHAAGSAPLTVEQHWGRFEEYVRVALSILKDLDAARDVATEAVGEMIEAGLALTAAQMRQRVRWRCGDAFRREEIETVAFEHFEYIEGGHPTPEQLYSAVQQAAGMVAEVGEANIDFLLQCNGAPLADVAADTGMTEGSVRVKRHLLRKKLNHMEGSK